MFSFIAIGSITILKRYDLDDEDVKTNRYQYPRKAKYSFFRTVVIEENALETSYPPRLLDEMENVIQKSKLEKEEFLCSGLCFCDEPNEIHERRVVSSTSSFSRGLFIAVTTLTSSLAFRKAKKHFENECVKKLSEECSSPSSIKSSVEECETSYLHLYSSISKNYDKPELERTFMCRGKCLSDKYPTYEFDQRQSWGGSFSLDCNQLERTSKVVMKDCRGRTNFICYQLAITHFQEHVLDPFCEKNSMRKYRFRMGMRSDSKRFKTVKLCTGGTGGFLPNPTISCSKIDS